MAAELDGATIEVPCPKCRYKSRKTVGWLKAHSELTCIGCGTRISSDGANIQRR